MNRICVHLTEQQQAALNERRELFGTPVGEQIRRALDAYLHGQVICLPCSGSLNSGQLQFGR